MEYFIGKTHLEKLKSLMVICSKKIEKITVSTETLKQSKMDNVSRDTNTKEICYIDNWSIDSNPSQIIR
eukprot:UN06186